MKNLIILLLALLAVPSFGATQIITGTVTLTNTAGTTNGQTIEINSAAREWTTNETSSGYIATNSTAAGAATNLFLALARYPTGLALSYGGTNSIKLQTAPGGALAITLSDGWGTVAYSSNTIGPGAAVRVPLSVEVAIAQTNVASGIVEMVGSSANTNAIGEDAPAVANLMGLGNDQTIAGAKSFTNEANVFAGAHSGTFELPSLQTLTNAQLYGNFNYVFGIIRHQALTPDRILCLDTFGNVTNTPISRTLFNAAMSAESLTSGALKTNTLLYGEAKLDSAAFRRYALAGLANGNNAAVAVGTNTFVEVSGPTGAFAVHGLADGIDGKLVILLNQTGQDMTLAHESGVDPTAGNRIVSLTGADQATTGNGAATLIYSSTAARWILLSVAP
jgi:hypothetical protein